MKHFDREEWIALKTGTLLGAKRAAMEDHLVICGQCRDVFLDLFGPDDLRQAADEIPDNFTTTVLRVCRPNKSAALKPAVRRGWRDWLVYYVAASVVTLVLVQGGVFQLLLDKAPRITGQPQPASDVRVTGLNWADTVAGEFSAWLNAFETTE